MISILVPTINYLEYLQLTIESIYKNTSVPFEIVVFDNGSDDGTYEWCTAKTDDNFTYLRSDENVGLSKAYNGMARASMYDLIMFANNDYYVAPGWDTAVLEVKRYGGWRGPMQVERDRPTRSITADYGTTPDNFDIEGFERNFNSNKVYPHRHYVPYMPTILRKDDFWNFGAYDETKFFCGQEFLWRAHNYFRKKGRLQLTCPTSYFYHFRCVTDLVKYEGEMIDWRKILRQENIDWLATQDITEEEQDAYMSHYGVHGPSMDADGVLVAYP